MSIKTYEKLAEEFLKTFPEGGDCCEIAFLGGYKAAKEKYEARIKELEQAIIKLVDAMAGVQYDNENT